MIDGQNDSGIIAVRFPDQEWMQTLIKKDEDKKQETEEWLARLDTVRIRKSLNKDEDNFVLAAVNVFMKKIDEKLKNHVEVEMTRIHSIENAVKEIISLELSMTKQKKRSLEEKVTLEGPAIDYAFYIYASDLKDLEEWKRLDSSVPGDMLTLFNQYRDDYILRIANRVAQELQTAIRVYAPLSQLQLKWKHNELEPLGELRYYRRKGKNVFGQLQKGTEGDYRKDSRHEAYNEDSSHEYCFQAKYLDRLLTRNYDDVLKARDHCKLALSDAVIKRLLEKPASPAVEAIKGAPL